MMKVLERLAYTMMAIAFASIIYAGVDSAKVQMATKDGTFVTATNPFPTTTRFSLFSSSGGLRVNVTNGFINLTTENVSASQRGTWTVNAKQSNYTTLNGRMYQGGTWTTGRTWTASSVTDSISAFQSNYSTLNARVYQGGSWNVGQSGNWSIFANITGTKGTVTLPQTALNTLFSNNTTGTGSTFNLGKLYSKHRWEIKSTKSTADVSWNVRLEGGINGVDFDPNGEDVSTTVAAFQGRNIANKPIQYVRAVVVQRAYTSTRPTITIQQISGGN